MMTWEEIKGEKSGTILHDEFDEGIRFIVMRGPAALCAYVGLPLEHPLSGHSYEGLSVRAHGGLTFANKGDGKWPQGYYWYGWDYAHSGDYSFYDDPHLAGIDRSKDHKWLVEDVINDSWSTIYAFKKLMKLAEQIKEGK